MRIRGCQLFRGSNMSLLGLCLGIEISFYYLKKHRYTLVVTKVERKKLYFNRNGKKLTVSRKKVSRNSHHFIETHLCCNSTIVEGLIEYYPCVTCPQLLIRPKLDALFMPLL